MSGEFLSIHVGLPSNEDAVTLRDLILLMLLPIVVAIVAPLALQIVTFVGERRRRRSEQGQLVDGLIDEIQRIESRNMELIEVFDTDLKNGQFREKMEVDPRYFVYITQGEPSHEVFDTKARDFSFMRKACFNALVEYYDTQSLIFQSMTDLRSDIFRELTTTRKLHAISAIVTLLEDNSLTYATCESELRRQQNEMTR